MSKIPTQPTVPEFPTQKWIENCSSQEYICYGIKNSKQSQAAISFALGFQTSSALNQIMSGRSKLAYGRIFDLAKELELDPILLRNKIFKEREPEYFQEEQRYLYTGRAFPLSIEIMQKAIDKGLKYGSLSKEQNSVLNKAFDEIKKLEFQKQDKNGS